AMLPTAVAKKGGTLRVDMTTDIDYADPSLSYYGLDWQIQHATALKLLNYPDAPAPRGKQLVPEAATGMPAVSNGGKTYTFKIRSGLKLSNGATITAANFKFAVDRLLAKSMHSPGAVLMSGL